MQVIISARGLTVSSTYRAALGRRLGKLERLLPKLMEAKIVLSKEKHRRTAALTLVAKHHTFRSAETAEDLSAAVDLAIAALGRQVREAKDRARSRTAHRTAARAVSAPPREERARGVAAAPAPGLVVRQVAPKPMSVEEAVEQLQLGPDQFLVFTNARTEAVNVLYRRKDGGLGLIEPVA